MKKVPRGIETRPVSPEVSVSQTVEVGQVQNESSTGSQHAVAFPQKFERVVYMLQYVIQAYLVGRVPGEGGPS